MMDMGVDPSKEWISEDGDSIAHSEIKNGYLINILRKRAKSVAKAAEAKDDILYSMPYSGWWRTEEEIQTAFSSLLNEARQRGLENLPSEAELDIQANESP